MEVKMILKNNYYASEKNNCNFITIKKWVIIFGTRGKLLHNSKKLQETNFVFDTTF